MGTTFQLYPRTIALSGISIVKLQCGDKNGRHPSMTVGRYALNALVVSFSLVLAQSSCNGQLSVLLMLISGDDGILPSPWLNKIPLIPASN